jgi:hypothetical protein
MKRFPHVAQLAPRNGATGVDPTLTELRIEFDRPMNRKGYSFVGNKSDVPAMLANGHFSDDAKTFIRPVKLEPGKTYTFTLNNVHLVGFRSAEGLRLDPVSWKFSTAKADTVPPSRGKEGNLHPKDPEPVPPAQLEAAIDRGVDFLVTTQNKDGSWGGPEKSKQLNLYMPVPGSHHGMRVAVTAMCVSALIESGRQSEKVLKALERGEAYLIEELPKVRRSEPGMLYNVWTYIYGIQALAHMHGRLPNDKDRQKKIEDLIRNQYDFMMRFEAAKGGWGYYDFGAIVTHPADSLTNTFTTAAALEAFYEAKQIGVPPPEKPVLRGIESIQDQRKPDFTYLYEYNSKFAPSAEEWSPAAGINLPAGSLGRSQSCNLALRLWGDQKVTDAVLKEWLDRLITRNGWLDIGRKRPIPHESYFNVAGYFYYFGHYYACLCIGQLPEKDRPFYQDHLARILMSHQEKDGSWWDYPFFNYHQPYGTAFVLMSLKQCRKEKSTSP